MDSPVEGIVAQPGVVSQPHRDDTVTDRYGQRLPVAMLSAAASEAMHSRRILPQQIADKRQLRPGPVEHILGRVQTQATGGHEQYWSTRRRQPLTMGERLEYWAPYRCSAWRYPAIHRRAESLLNHAPNTRGHQVLKESQQRSWTPQSESHQGLLFFQPAAQREAID